MHDEHTVDWLTTVRNILLLTLLVALLGEFGVLLMAWKEMETHSLPCEYTQGPEPSYGEWAQA